MRTTPLVVAVFEHARADGQFHVFAVVVFELAEHAAALAHDVVTERAETIRRDRQPVRVQAGSEVLPHAVGVIAVAVDGGVQR
nr:hypothetical protein [Xanthomonas populi]